MSESMQMEKYQRPEADIHAPSDYKELIDKTINRYKKWLKENKHLQEIAEQAETEEERAAALQVNTDHFKHFFAGVISKDDHKRLSVSQIKNIWERFIKEEYRSFLQAHLNLTLEQIMRIGIDKFVYVMGWKKPGDIPSWHNNKIRIGVCCHCKDQFIPMILQHNHGLCVNCRPNYSTQALRQFIINQLNTSERYYKAQHDLLMDFYIMFYHDESFRQLFLKNSRSAELLEKMEGEIPEWATPNDRKKERESVEFAEAQSDREKTDLRATYENDAGDGSIRKEEA